MTSTDKPDPVEVEIGERLRTYRQMRGLTQGEVGRRIGVSFQQVQRYERAENHIKAPTLIRFCQTLGISPNELLRASQPDVISIATEFTHGDATALELMRAFHDIASPELRRSIVRLVQAAAAPKAGAEGAPVRIARRSARR